LISAVNIAGVRSLFQPLLKPGNMWEECLQAFLNVLSSRESLRLVGLYTDYRSLVA